MTDRYEYDSKIKSNKIPIYKKTNSNHSIDLSYDVSLDQDSSESTNDITCIGSLDRYFNILNTKKKNLSSNQLSRTAPSDTYVTHSPNKNDKNDKDVNLYTDDTYDKEKKYKRRSKGSNVFIMD